MKIRQWFKVFWHCLCGETGYHQLQKEVIYFKMGDHVIRDVFYFCTCGFNDTRIYDEKK